MENLPPVSLPASRIPPVGKLSSVWYRSRDRLLYACLLGYLLVNTGLLGYHSGTFDFLVACLVFGIVMPVFGAILLAMIQAVLLCFSPAALSFTLLSLGAAGWITFHLAAAS